MNTVGKIFVGIIALMSVVCLTVSVLSYASHHNWKEKSDELQKQLKAAQDEKSSLNAQKTELTQKINDASEEYAKSVDALKTYAEELKSENDELKKQNEQLTSERELRENMVYSNDQHIADLRQQLSVTSNDLAEAQQLRANYLQTLAQTLEKLHNLSAIHGDLKEQNDELVQLYDQAVVVLQQHGLEADPSKYTELPKFQVQGVISQLSDQGDDLVQITIGSDDGLNEHNMLDVRRGNSYLGRLEVLTVEPNRAICKIVPEFRQGIMKEGDDVYSQKF
ncbi:MAG: hypothetical protein Q4G03_07650 [Planctomycetia bacterium]|nr:hypothetical protein [Planctomycetia bacterium]